MEHNKEQSSLQKQIEEALDKNLCIHYSTNPEVGDYVNGTGSAAKAIEVILKQHAIDFAEWLRENEMRPEAGGWVGGKINVFDVGYKSRHLHKLYISQLQTTNP